MRIEEEVKKPNKVIVSTPDRFVHEVARLISRKTLIKICEKECEFAKFKNGIQQFNNTFICEDYLNAKEISCLWAWKLTIGKGKKIY